MLQKVVNISIPYIRYLNKKKIGSYLIKLRNLEQKFPLEIATIEKKIVRLLSF